MDTVVAAPLRQGARSDIVAAARDTSSIGLSMFPLGMALGVLVAHSGFAWWWATVITAVIYAGSLEFLVIGLVTAVAPLSHIALTAFLVNSRHVFYALSFPLHRVKGRLGKAYSTYTLTDEAYALTATAPAESLSSGRILWLQAFLQTYWVSGATTGALLGSLIPARLTGLDFALTALFVVLAIDAYRARRDIPTPALALVCAAVAMTFFPEQMLLVAMGLFTAGLLVRFAVRDSEHADA
jgi:4-azaleucine resistance transporter AzlC